MPFCSPLLIPAANLLLTISDSIKLANFGLVRDLVVDGFGIAIASDITVDFRGTLLYVAPEVLTSELGPGNRKAYGKPADVWALGCTLIEMLTKYPPHFEYFGHVEAIQKEILDRASGEKSNWLPYDADVLVPTCSSSVHKLVEVIFERDPSIRPNTTELCDIVQSIVHYGNRTSTISHGPCMSGDGARLEAVKMKADQNIDENVRKDSAKGSLPSCCMVALGEFKFRIANKTLRESRFFVQRPQHDLVLCGVTILRAKRNAKEQDEEEQFPPTIPPIVHAVHTNSVDQNFYYK
ncbi:hypothetical protein TELCIR_05029 [Teladorsagia circumcincta]|uniref:Protein kinase domain-containing protein n=1 Tax=Teladorsagia circumcincta TaxID=45464 RepID=A0A2G9URZ2_TELCI|nr:hypothetical protein TELCIR_05029 [Teladorsagia circumcincta]